MSLKSLLTAATLIAGSSSAALANPVVSFNAGASVSYGPQIQAGYVYPVVNGSQSTPVVNGSYTAPVVNGAEPCETPAQTGYIQPTRLPIIEPMPVTRPTLLASESRIFKGTETFWVGAQRGRFQTLKLETAGFKSFVSNVKIHFADGHTQTVWLNEYINSRNPCVTIDLDGVRPRAIKSIELTGANARQSTLKLIAA